MPEKKVSDELAKRKAPRALVQFVRCTSDAVELAADQMDWLVSRLPVKPDRIDLRPTDGGGVEVQAVTSVLGAEVTFGITLGISADGRLEARAVDAPPGTEGTARETVDDWLRRLNDELAGHGRRFGELRIVNGRLRFTKVAITAPPMGTGAVGPAPTEPAPPKTPPPAAGGGTTPQAPASPPVTTTPAEEPGGCGLPFFGIMVLALIGLFVLGGGAILLFAGGDGDDTADVTAPTPAPVTDLGTTSRGATATTDATDATNAPPARPVGDRHVRCMRVFVNHEGRLVGFPSSVIFDGQLVDVTVWAMVVDDAGTETEYAGTVNGGSGYLEFGISHFGPYRIVAVTATLPDGSEVDITDDVVDALGTDIVDVGPDQGVVTGNPQCTQPAGASDPVRAFFADFVRAQRAGDAGFLYDHLHPFVVERFGEEQCRAYLEGLDVPEFDAEVLDVGTVGPWTWTTDGVSRPVDGATELQLRFADVPPDYREVTAHVIVGAGGVQWFTDCGTPLPGAP